MATSSIDRLSVEATLRDYLVENSNVSIPGPLGPDENLLDGGILDSLGIAEITEFMEKNFSIVIDEDEVSSRNYGTLHKLTDFCHSKLVDIAA